MVMPGTNLDQHDVLGRFAHRALHLLVPGVADQHDRVTLGGELPGLHVHLGHQRTRGVDRLGGLVAGVLVDLGATPWAENTTVSPFGTSVS